jgi:xanthine dehydrogenase YagT iron-sulfur-binding subunit
MPVLEVEAEGCPHPRLLLGATTILAFCARWTSASEALRTELRGLGATLVVLTPAGGMRLQPDDPPEKLRPAPALWSAFSAAPPPALTLLLLDPDGEVRLRRSSAQAVEPESILLQAIRAAGKEVRAQAAFARGPAPRSGAAAPPRSEIDSAPRLHAGLPANRSAPSSTGATRRTPLRGLGRRDLLLSALASALAVAVLDACAVASPRSQAPVKPALGPDLLDVTLEINGEARKLRLDPRTTLLDALRENLGLTGTKKGCDLGQCGACTVLVDGKRIDSCLALAAQHDGRKVTTIEGLADGPRLHPMQAAFLEEDAFQCGYCTPGQILSAVALLKEGRASTDEEIREGMSGNLCRCGAYPNILLAIRRVRS